MYGGWRVPADYDSLLAKLIVHAPTRAEAIVRMRRALDEFIVAGIRTNIDLHKALLADHEVVEGTMATRTIERIISKARMMSRSMPRNPGAAAPHREPAIEGGARQVRSRASWDWWRASSAVAPAPGPRAPTRPSPAWSSERRA